MMKFLVLALLATFSVSAFSRNTQPRHIVSIGTDGLGWSGLKKTYKWDEDKSGVSDHTNSESSIKLNYNYVFNNRWMVGGEFSSESSSTTITPTSGTDIKTDTAETSLGLSVGYNFSYNYCCAWWIKGTLGTGTSSDKTVDSTGTDETKFGYSFYALTVGKRFSIELFGLKNFSYSPAITMTSAKMTGSTHSDGLNSASELKLDILRLDILF